jgi:hemoglobin-like flavoprotein
MTSSELINLSLEQVAEALGDPTAAVFARMYERYPALKHFRGEDSSWENYMMQEILSNILQYADEPETALVTIKDMTTHHQLIGVPLDVFKGMYSTLLDVLKPTFQGEQQAAMAAAWQQAIDAIHRVVDQQSAF